METDDDYLTVYRPDALSCGWVGVRFIYGNDGYDVICDYTMSLESVLTPVNQLADELAS